MDLLSASAYSASYASVDVTGFAPIVLHLTRSPGRQACLRWINARRDAQGYEDAESR